MKTFHKLGATLGVASVLVLGGCADMNPPYATSNGSSTYPQNNSNNNSYVQYGEVQAIEMVRQNNTAGIGIGTIAGAVVGGIVGNQVGAGSGNTAATVLGAAGGAYAGHELEKRNQQQQVDAYKLTIRMRDGSYQTVVQSSSGNIRVGDRVQIENGIARRY